MLVCLPWCGWVVCGARACVSVCGVCESVSVWVFYFFFFLSSKKLPTLILPVTQSSITDINLIGPLFVSSGLLHTTSFACMWL